MSIFTVEQCWFTRLSRYNMFSPTCLVTANLLGGAEEEQGSQVIVGDDSGKIIILLPSKRNKSHVDFASHGVDEEHLLAHDTHLAIQDLKVGRFNKADLERNSLAVVHTQKVSVYTLVKLSTVVDKTSTALVTAEEEEEYPYREQTARIGDPYELTLLYELKLDRDIFRAYVSPNANESKMLDCLVVQSMDCHVHLYLGSTVLGSKRLYHQLIPGPMAVTDCNRVLITFSTTMHLEGYKLDELIYDSPKQVASRDPLLPSWTFSLHEPIFTVGVTCPRHANSDQTSALFVAIGRHGIYVVSEEGQLISSRQLDLTPCHLLVYGAQEKHTGNGDAASDTLAVPWEPKFILTTMESHLLVFKGTQIVWSAKIPWHTLGITMPTQLIHDPSTLPPTVGVNFPPGLISVLDSEGFVRLAYLGTNALTNVLPCSSAQADGDSNVNHTTAPQDSPGLDLKQMELELEELNSQIRTRTKHLSIDNPLPSAIPSHSHKASLQVKLRDQKTPGDSASHLSLDVFMSFCIYSSPADLDPVYLVAHSCAPIKIVPNYMNFPTSQPENTDSIVSNPTVFKRFCSLAVDLDQTHALCSKLPLDLTVRLVLGYSEPQKADGAFGISRFVETSVRLPLHWFCDVKPVKKTQVTGLYRLTFDVAPELVARELRLHTLLPNLWPSNDKGTSVFLNAKTSRNSNPQNDVDGGFCGVYILENVKKGQIRLQGNYPEYFEPVLQELLFELSRFCSESGIHARKSALLSLRPSKSKESLSSSGRITPEPSVVAQTMGFLCNYMFECLCKHLESRLALATQVAANSVQARHFRAVQSHVFTRIQDQVPVSLNGFDTLLEASLHSLIQGCQSVIERATDQLISGASVISMINLLQLLCRKCIARQNATSTASSSKPYVDLSLLDPGRLWGIVEANESVEVTRGTDTLPEGEDSTGPDSPSYVGLEEYLDLTLSLILSQTTGQDCVGVKNYSTAVIPDINRLMQKLLSVLTVMVECEETNLPPEV